MYFNIKSIHFPFILPVNYESRLMGRQNILQFFKLNTLQLLINFQDLFFSIHLEMHYYLLHHTLHLCCLNENTRQIAWQPDIIMKRIPDFKFNQCFGIFRILVFFFVSSLICGGLKGYLYQLCTSTDHYKRTKKCTL